MSKRSLTVAQAYGETLPELERVIDLKKIRLFSDLFAPPNESWNGLGPDDTPLFVRDISTHEIYALDLQLP